MYYFLHVLTGMFGPNPSCFLQMSGCLYSPHSTDLGCSGGVHVTQAGFGPEVWKEFSDSGKSCIDYSIGRNL